jgi:hypothetical protein
MNIAIYGIGYKGREQDRRKAGGIHVESRVMHYVNQFLLYRRQRLRLMFLLILSGAGVGKASKSYWETRQKSWLRILR